MKKTRLPEDCRTIWHRSNFVPDNLVTDNLAPDNLAPGQWALLSPGVGGYINWTKLRMQNIIWYQNEQYLTSAPNCQFLPMVSNCPGAKLSGVKFSGANLSVAKLSSAKLSGGKLSGAKLSQHPTDRHQTVRIPEKYLRDARFWDNRAKTDICWVMLNWVN